MRASLAEPRERRSRSLAQRLRTPALVWFALICLLGAISAIGVFRPHGHWWIAELGCMLTMIALVLVFSMEMRRHAPIVRVFSFVGFFWVGILFGLIMVDYLTRGPGQ